MSKAFRIKCPKCGSIQDLMQSGPCPKCGTNIAVEQPGVLQIYRMGSPLGVAVGYGIYINDVPYGHLGNTESIRIPLPFGTYKIHMTCGATRRCQDLTVTLGPTTPWICMKAHIKPGFWTNTIIIENANPSEMPPL